MPSFVVVIPAYSTIWRQMHSIVAWGLYSSRWLLDLLAYRIFSYLKHGGHFLPGLGKRRIDYLGESSRTISRKFREIKQNLRAILVEKLARKRAFRSATLSVGELEVQLLYSWRKSSVEAQPLPFTVTRISLVPRHDTPVTLCPDQLHFPALYFPQAIFGIFVHVHEVETAAHQVGGVGLVPLARAVVLRKGRGRHGRLGLGIVYHIDADIAQKMGGIKFGNAVIAVGVDGGEAVHNVAIQLKGCILVEGRVEQGNIGSIKPQDTAIGGISDGFAKGKRG